MCTCNAKTEKEGFWKQKCDRLSSFSLICFQSVGAQEDGQDEGQEDGQDEDQAADQVADQDEDQDVDPDQVRVIQYTTLAVNVM